MPRKATDRTGNRQGKLTVLRRVTSGSEFNRIRQYSTSAVWLCLCDCGTTKLITGENLQKGQQSCGCTNAAINEVGNRYGRLVVKEQVTSGIEYQQKRKGTLAAVWRCQCDCGEEIFVRGPALRYGSSLSCGCWQEDAASIACAINGPPILVLQDQLAQTRIANGSHRRGCSQ